MSRPQPWPFLLLLLLALAGCAAQPPPTHPAVVRSVASPPVAHPEAVELSPLPPVVAENQTFVTIDGVPRYKIDPGDVLEVFLTRKLAHERLSVPVRVNGKVTVGFFEATVAGLTTEQAAREIHRILAPAYRQLTVEVMLKEHRSKTVSVLGAVGRDGRFPLKGKTNLLDLLIEAGGPGSNADLSEVRVLRPDGQSYTVNLLRILYEGKRVREVILDAGDVVFVPTRRPETDKKVFVLGEVGAPGAYPLRPDMRLSQALALAGGTKDTAALASARVIRGDLHNPQLVEVDFKRVIVGRDRNQDLALQANDLIVLPRSAIANWNGFLAKLRPTLQFLALPLQPVFQLLLLQDAIRD